MVWEWYAWRREAIASARPNAAHDVLAAWSRRWQRMRRHHSERGRSPPFASGRVAWFVCTGRSGSSRAGAAAAHRRGGTRTSRCRNCLRCVAPAAAWPGRRWCGSERRCQPQRSTRRWRPASATCSCRWGRRRSSIPPRRFWTRARSSGAFTVEINTEATPTTAVVDSGTEGPRRPAAAAPRGPAGLDQAAPKPRRLRPWRSW